MDKQAFAKRLRKQLRVNHITVKELSASVGASRNTVYGWLRGKQLPQTFYLVPLRRALECEWDELLGW